MMKYTLILLLACVGCTGGGDDTYEDNRVCIVNDAFNDNSDNSVTNPVEQLAEEASDAGLSVEKQLPSQVAVCGTAIDVDAAIGNGDSQLLSDFLTGGSKV